MTMRPVYVKLDEFAASTSPPAAGEQPVVGLGITVAVETLASNGGDVDLRHYQRNFELHDVAKGKEYLKEDVKQMALLPNHSGQPTKIVVSATETGDKFQSAEDFEKIFARQDAIIWNGLGGSLNARLTEYFKN